MSKNKVKIIPLLTAKTLEATEAGTQAATARVVVDTFYSDTLNLVCKYTTGAGETSNTCSVTVWGYVGNKSDDNDFPYSDAPGTSIVNDTDNWVQIGEHSITTGTATFVATTFNIVGASAATTYTGQFSVDITYPKIRIAASESGVATNKGTLTAVALIQ